MPGAKDLTAAWRAAAAAKASDFTLLGVARGPRVADPHIEDESWVAWARGPKDLPMEGTGSSPEEALRDLAGRIRAL
jgi:hypothetical protein